MFLQKKLRNSKVNTAPTTLLVMQGFMVGGAHFPTVKLLCLILHWGTKTLLIQLRKFTTSMPTSSHHNKKTIELNKTSFYEFK